MIGAELMGDEHRRIVDNFIKEAIDVLAENIAFLERNELEVNLRFYVETQLLPGLLAMNALLLQASPHALEKDLPDWIERAITAPPSEAAFLADAGKMIDLNSYTLLQENLDLAPDQCMSVKVFHAHVVSMTLMVA